MNDAIASLRPALAEIAEELGLTLDADRVDTLLAYLALLRRWNATYNLTAIREPRQMLTQHLADCLSIIGPLRRETGGRAATVLDVGSGAGLPGVVVAIVCAELTVTCVDTVGKKVAFLRQAAAELALPNLRAEQARVESLEARPFDVVTSRAFASLADFTTSTRRLVAPQGRWLAMKGKYPDDELAQLPPAVQLFHVEQIAVPGLEGERCLVWMRPVH